MKFLLLIFGLAFVRYAHTQQLEVVCDLPSVLNESSGLLSYTDSTFLSINDSGGEAAIYEFSKTGILISTTKFPNLKNVDWEELTSDKDGYIYIGDFGNNENKRKKLTIYKFHSDSIGKQIFQTEIIRFSYPEQEAFPPDKNEMLYDAETFLVWENELLIFTKCRDVPFTGRTFIYSIPTKAGNYTAKRINTFIIGSKNWLKHSVTGACYYNEGIALLTYSHWYYIREFNPYNDFWNIDSIEKHKCKDIRQREAITQGLDGFIYITDEKRNYLGGGKLYRWRGKELK
jgi:hypothetical protein